MTGQPGDLWSYATLGARTLSDHGSGSAFVTEMVPPYPKVPWRCFHLTYAPPQRGWPEANSDHLGASDPNAGPSQYRGDVYFDYYHRYANVPPGNTTGWRPSGSDGQILFYVNQHSDDEHPAVAVGVCLLREVRSSFQPPGWGNRR